LLISTTSENRKTTEMANSLVLLLLDKANNLSLIDSYILWAYYLLYFARRAYDLSKRERADQMLISKDVSRHAVSLAFALWVQETGRLVTRIFVSFWRAGTGGHGGTASIGQALGLTSGALILVFGSILILRVLSRPLYGEWVWVSVVLVNAGYVVVSSLI
jgi:hypothetical protein